MGRRKSRSDAVEVKENGAVVVADAPDPAPSSLLEQALGTVGRALKSLDECVTRVTTMLTGDDEYDTKLASHLAWLVDKQTSILGELRQQEKHEKLQRETLTPEQRHSNVLLYLEHEMPAAKREEVRLLIDRLDREGKLL